MRVGLARDLGQLVDDVLRRRSVGIAHAEVDDVLAAPARGGLHRVDLGEDVGRKALDSVKVGVHRPTHAAYAALRQARVHGGGLVEANGKDWVESGHSMEAMAGRYYSEVKGRSEACVHEHANHYHVNKRLDGVVHPPSRYRCDNKGEQQRQHRPEKPQPR